MAESLDALMDIFAEDETDHLAIEIELVQRLSSLLPHFKSKVNILSCAICFFLE